MKNKIFFLVLLGLSLPVILIGQDFHFSEAYLSPLTLNPASVGSFKGDYRMICNYKDQWSSISKTYKTVFASAELVTFRKKRSGSFLGTGLSFYNDRAGKSKMGSTQINLCLAYNLKLNKNNFFAAGLQSGFVQKGVNVNNLKWDNQFNGTSYDPDLASGETYQSEQVNFVDFAAGLKWDFVPDEKNKITFGVSMFHVNKPNQSFSKENKDPLHPKFLVHGDAQIKIGKKNTSIVPVILFTNQGKQNEINFGGLIKYGIGLDSKYTEANKSSTISLGALYRYMDAIAILMNMNYKSMFTFGFSYDVNISELTKASKGRGGMELCIVYSGAFQKK